MSLRNATYSGDADQFRLKTVAHHCGENEPASAGQARFNEMLRSLVAFGVGCLVMLLLTGVYLFARQHLATTSAPPVTSPAMPWN